VNVIEPRWLISPSVRSTQAKDGALLLDVRKGLSYRLNVLGAQVWVAIEKNPQGITLQGVVDDLQARFPVSREQLELDTADWLDKLTALGLLQKANGQVANSG